MFYLRKAAMLNSDIETRADILAGEPVLKGTRIAARHVAELVERGESPEAIAADLDLSLKQIKAAVAFAARKQIRPEVGV